MLRAKRNQTDLAHRLGISQAAVSRRLSGLVPFRADELAATADYLGVSVDTLLPVPSADAVA